MMEVGSKGITGRCEVVERRDEYGLSLSFFSSFSFFFFFYLFLPINLPLQAINIAITLASVAALQVTNHKRNKKNKEKIWYKTTGDHFLEERGTRLSLLWVERGRARK